MVTISHIVKKIISNKPFIQEALSRGIVNHAALAEEIKDDVEREYGSEVKFSAVNMAIRRYADTLDKIEFKRPRFHNTNIIIQSDLIEITVYKTAETHNLVKKTYEIVDHENGDFLTVTRGLNETMLITNSKYEKQIVKIFGRTKKIIKDIASLTINIPHESYQTIGLFYLVTRQLAWENVNIIDMVSTYTEMTIILNDKDVPMAYQKLRELINSRSSS